MHRKYSRIALIKNLEESLEPTRDMVEMGRSSSPSSKANNQPRMLATTTTLLTLNETRADPKQSDSRFHRITAPALSSNPCRRRGRERAREGKKSLLSRCLHLLPSFTGQRSVSCEYDLTELDVIAIIILSVQHDSLLQNNFFQGIMLALKRAVLKMTNRVWESSRRNRTGCVPDVSEHRQHPWQ